MLYEYIDPELSPQAAWTLQHVHEISDILGLSEQVVEIWHMFESCNLELKSCRFGWIWCFVFQCRCPFVDVVLQQNALAGHNFAHKIGAHQLSAKRIAQQIPRPTHLGSQFPTLMVVFAIYVHLSRLVRICVQLSPSARV